MWIGHRKEIQKLTFRALALLRSESRNCGLCAVYIQKYGAMLLVGAWQREKQHNKLVQRKAVVDTVRIKSARLKNKFLFQSFAAFCNLTERSLIIPCWRLEYLEFLLLKVAQNTFQGFPRRRFWWVAINTLYQLMLQSWYQKNAQSLVNTLVLFLWQNRLP